MTVDKYPYTDKNSRVLIEAWKELGLSELDYNGINGQIGVNHYQSTVLHGSRQSSNGAFLRPIRAKRSNLVIRSNALATRIIIDPETKRVEGVEYSVSGDRNNLRIAYVKKEVVVSAGVFESPKILMLSGIGHRAELESLGVKVMSDLPVGDNLQDHVLFPAIIGVFDRNTSTLVSPDQMRNDAVYWLNTHEGSYKL